MSSIIKQSVVEQQAVITPNVVLLASNDLRMISFHFRLELFYSSSIAFKLFYSFLNDNNISHY